MDRWRALAAANNAEWCDLVSRSHGALTRFDDDAWTSRTRTPPYFPDAVTLVTRPSPPDLLARVDVSAGCSIKDSFATLDLSKHGFHVLLDAQWIVRPGTSPPPRGAKPHWKRVVDATSLAGWEKAWRGDDGAVGLFRPDLVDRESVAVLAAYVDDRVVAGAVFNRSATVVGVSNFFVRSGLGPAAWSGCLALAAELFPATPFVGYESGEDLIAAQVHGFETAGPLRVWIHHG